MTDRARENKQAIFLTKAEALTFAAQQLQRMASDRNLAAIIIASVNKGPALTGNAAAKLAELRREMPDPERQAKACRDASDAILELALEERLAHARAFS